MATANMPADIRTKLAALGTAERAAREKRYMKSEMRHHGVTVPQLRNFAKQYQQEFDLNLARCWMIGHRTIDILAASRAEMATIMVETGEGGRDGAFHVEPHYVESNIVQAVNCIRSFEAAQRV